MTSIRTTDYTRVLESLVSARKDRDILQTAVAKALGKPQSFVSKYETGERRLDIAEFVELCRVLGTNPIDLLLQAGLITAGDVEAAGQPTVSVKPAKKSS